MASVTELYGVAAAGSAILLVAIRSVIRLRPLLEPCGALLQKNILDLRLLPRHRFFGPWTFAQVAMQLLYLTANLFCIMFRVSDTNEAATRAGQLSLINMAPAYFGFHTSFASDLLGISLSTYRILHASTGCMSVLLGLIHALIHVSSTPLRPLIKEQLLGLVVSQLRRPLSPAILH